MIWTFLILENFRKNREFDELLPGPYLGEILKLLTLQIPKIKLIFVQLKHLYLQKI